MRALFALSVVSDVLSRLTLFGAALTLVVAHDGRVTLAALIAGGAAIATLARNLLRAELTARALDRVYVLLLDGIRKKTVSDLLSNRDRERAASLVYETSEVAELLSGIVPELIASFALLAMTLVVVAARLGAGFLGAGLAATLVVLAVLAPARKLARRVREQAFRAQFRAERLVEAMVMGALELRAAAAEPKVATLVEAQSRAMSHALRDSQRLNSAVATLPAAFALLLYLVPQATVERLLGANVGEAGVLALVGVTVALRAADAMESYVRSAPMRKALFEFTGDEAVMSLWRLSAPTERRTENPSESAEIRSIRFDRVSVRYDGGPATPSSLSFTIERGGLALLGPNGVGKSSALLAAVGLIEHAGQVEINGAAPSSEAWASLRARVLIVPQRPHVAPDEPLSWHVGMFGARPVDPKALEVALRRLGLWDRLAQRAAQRGVEVAGLPMGELSGGEQRRVALTRILVLPSDVILLDEPEASLDAAGRGLVRELLEELAETRLVLVAAHDPAILPASFQRVELTREAVPAIGG